MDILRSRAIVGLWRWASDINLFSPEDVAMATIYVDSDLISERVSIVGKIVVCVATAKKSFNYEARYIART